jgi:hypothetical protein
LHQTKAIEATPLEILHNQSHCCLTATLQEGEQGVDGVLVEEVDVVTIGVGGVIVERKAPCQHGIEHNAVVLDIDNTANIVALI